MKLIANSIAQLFVIIMLTITFAVSLTALSMWADPGTAANDSQAVATTLHAEVH